MNGLDIIINELRGARADLEAENARPMHIDAITKPPRFNYCAKCGHNNEYRTVCWKCGADLIPGLK